MKLRMPSLRFVINRGEGYILPAVEISLDILLSFLGFCFFDFSLNNTEKYRLMQAEINAVKQQIQPTNHKNPEQLTPVSHGPTVVSLAFVDPERLLASHFLFK